MFREGTPIDYNAPAELKKWPSLNSQRCHGTQPYLVFHGTLAECIQELMAKHVKAISLYDIFADLQPAFDQAVLSPGDAAEISMRKDFPKETKQLLPDKAPSAGRGIPRSGSWRPR